MKFGMYILLKIKLFICIIYFLLWRYIGVIDDFEELFMFVMFVVLLVFMLFEVIRVK